ncbi:Cytochrome b-c1 complex subunit 7 [Phytophthora cinnamomi]|uniref:Cytochrome b-c1 complex subunit 7 n=1 Tax=Phytophthora cinnamomi TaxID=4785 RepID=UPI003559B915|nr:Cytochrome b-c1 complex subunit 7 [Phytophthora cinnamomi]
MSLISKVAGLYQKSVSKSFGMYGLKYDDALVDTAAVQTALHWVTGDDYQARTKRIARATDCSLKRSYLPDEIQAIQRPLDFYISDKAVEAEKLAEERAELTRW